MRSRAIKVPVRLRESRASSRNCLTTAPCTPSITFHCEFSFTTHFWPLPTPATVYNFSPTFYPEIFSPPPHTFAAEPRSLSVNISPRNFPMFLRAARTLYKLHVNKPAERARAEASRGCVSRLLKRLLYARVTL